MTFSDGGLLTPTDLYSYVHQFQIFKIQGEQWDPFRVERSLGSQSLYSGKKSGCRGPSDIPEQLGQRQVQRNRNPFDIHKPDISLSTFDSANIGTVQSAHISKLFLRHTKLLSP
jgi:hypothetical protein